MVFTAVKAAHPPTTVEFAAPCSMVQGGGRNLVGVKNTLLELYLRQFVCHARSRRRWLRP